MGQRGGVLKELGGVALDVQMRLVGDRPAYDLADLFQPGQVGALVQFVEQSVAGLPVPVCELLKDGFLAGEVVVDRSLGEVAKLIDDVLHRGVFESLFGEQLLRGIEDAPPCDFRMCVARHGLSFRARPHVPIY